MSTIQPIQPAQRIYSLDVLRGFALFGVLWAYTSFEFGTAPEESYSRLEFYVGWFMEVFKDNKFYPILAFLFGLGFSIQLKKAKQNNPQIIAAYIRRLIGLILIGLIYSISLRDNILVPYAVCGFVLLPLRHASNKTLLLVGIIVYIYNLVTGEFLKELGLNFPKLPDTSGLSFSQANLIAFQQEFTSGTFYWFGSLPLILLGFYMGREGIFEKISTNRKTLLQIIFTGFAIGLTSYILREFLIPFWRGTSLVLIQKFCLRFLWWSSAWGMAAFYTAFLLLLLRKKSWRDRLFPLSLVGKMALTNYILQGLMLVPLCITFNLFDKATPLLALLVTLIFYTLHVLLSTWWLKYHTTGPLEWLLHRFVYGNLQNKPVIDIYKRQLK